MDIKVKYFDKNMPKLVQNEKGDWIDLRVVNARVCMNTEDDIMKAIKGRQIDDWTISNKMYYGPGAVIVMRLGVAIDMPINKKSNVYTRSSTFPVSGLILTNSVGCIDNKYKGDNDEWLAVYYATRAGFITKYDRVCQFESTDRMEKLNIIEVDKMENSDRGGHGTTGKQ